MRTFAPSRPSLFAYRKGVYPSYQYVWFLLLHVADTLASSDEFLVISGKPLFLPEHSGVYDCWR